MSGDDYTKDAVYKESRIKFVDSEIKYFKETYLKSATSYSLYSTLNSLLHYVNETGNYELINQNYTNFNKLMYEGMYLGSFEGNNRTDLENKTLKYFIDRFNQDFYVNYKGNFSYKVRNINIYEEQPYYVSILVFGEYEVTTVDNISTWHFIDKYYVSVPIYNLDDPEFMLQGKAKVPLKHSEYELGDWNWTLPSFIETIENTYTSIYIEPDYEYSIGNSYLGRFLNISRSAYKDVLGYWNFNLDENKDGVFDNSLHNPLGKHYGNTRLAFNFEPNYINGSTIYDLSHYNNNGTIINGAINCSVAGSNQYGCKFNKAGYIIVPKEKLNLNDTNKLSLSVWVKPNEDNQTIFSYGNSSDENITLKTRNKKIVFEVGNHQGGTFYSFVSNRNISLGNWTSIITTYNGDTKEGKIWINGFWSNVVWYNEVEVAQGGPINNFLNSSKDIEIGRDFNGTIDEIGIFSKILTNWEISEIVDEKRTKLIDYKKSLHKKAIKFDGKDDYIEIEQNIFNANRDEYSIEFWFRFDKVSPISNFTLLDLPKNAGVGDILNVKIVNQSYVWFFSEHNSNNNTLKVRYNFEKEINYHLLLTFDGTQKTIYINGNRTGNVSFSDPLDTTGSKLYLGVNYNDGNLSEFYNGYLDEVKIHNKNLNYFQVKQNYFNYPTYGYGCCNYITLVNPNKFGYNDTFYKKNVSYSSKLFYDYHNRNLKYNITLSNFTGVTSQITSEKYYNFIFDDCINKGYNIENFMDQINNITKEWVVHPTNSTDNESCSNLIKLGIY